MYITGKKVIITQNNGIIKCFQKENGIFLWENQFLYNRNVIILKKKKEVFFLSDDIYNYKLLLENGIVSVLNKHKKKYEN